MPKAQVTIADVDQAEAELLAAKKRKSDRDGLRAAKNRLVEVRSAWRAQEEAAGRRSPVGTVSNKEG